ncbi:alpha/beta hydrolase [Williamsoniiplasma lucivorax]|uniref:Hydrolase n=1 Tax=Williamsoniiplasma lucivorax TaxID=209274 RepID=A0A2S5RA04_9MOLU|nr:alpha/beta hydrolase [Williamsoniiplasma lucivorax]PPE04130.1 hydrolase [Williamsoniiplasma lucivorax]
MHKFAYNWWRMLIVIITLPFSLVIALIFKHKFLKYCFTYERNNNIQEFLADLDDKQMDLEIPIDFIETFKIKTDQGEISALKLVNNNPEKWVIGLHGWTENKYLGLRLVMHFYNLGYSILTFDSFAHGASYGEKTDIGYSSIVMIDEIINYLKKTYQAKELGLIGNSMGASTAILYGQKGVHQKAIKWIIADCGFANLDHQLNWRSNQLSKLNWMFTNLFIRAGFQKATGLDPRTYDLIPNITYPTPTMFVHSKSDSFIPYQASETMYQIRNNPKDLLWLPTGPEHVRVLADLNEEYQEKIQLFLKQKTRNNEHLK